MNDSSSPENAPNDPEERIEQEGHAEQVRPGQRLRQAREALSLTREEVAKQLHLDVHLVTALEANDYRSMPAPIYVSGYLRNYARLLQLPEEEIVAAYGGGTDQPDLLPNIDLQPQASGTDTLVRLVTYGLILGLVVLLLLWWFGVGQSRNAPPTTAAPAASAPATSAPATSAPATPASSATGGNEGAAPAAPKGTSGAPAALAGSRAGSTAANNVSAGSAQPEQRLSLHYTENSWTEVQDATGRQLVYRLVKAGDTLELSGVAPFEVVLGNAPGVTIEYNGQPFNKGHVGGNNVGQFVVGKAVASTHKAAAATSGTE